ncbi:hypothetical protein PoMZ_09066 [Pyricularia oryzae]|uniref:Uncharacterized protein n=1 Tax=Pyricularia oryzae TaxID=318829 RepID=A0A4P7MT33_PYROR|nr:hypothetical protein PoMZ_09066 [Pyricularia oryzae]
MKFFIILFAAMTTSVLAANPANPAKPAKPAKPAPPADPCVTIRAACTKSCIGEPPGLNDCRVQETLGELSAVIHLCEC